MKHDWWYDKEGDETYDTAYTCLCGATASKAQLTEALTWNDCTRVVSDHDGS